MGTNANLPGKQDGNHGCSSSAQGGGGGKGGDTSTSGVKSSNGAAATAASLQALKHDPGIAVDWTAEEQATLEEMSSKKLILVIISLMRTFGWLFRMLLVLKVLCSCLRYASDPPVVRYAKIAKHLPEKTVRDVALRSRWMTRKESGKRRKDESLSRKSKDKKERATDSSGKPSHMAARPNVPPYAMPILPMENDDDISCKAIGGPSGQLLEHTAQIFNQIHGNFNSLQINDNITLFCQARDNILVIMNELDDIPGVMKQMPPLPVKLNEDLANTILPSTIHPRTPMPPSS